jgi:hypothetical protein
MNVGKLEKVAPIAPMTRGLKVTLQPMSIGPLTGVAPIAPMTRGLKGSRKRG